MSSFPRTLMMAFTLCGTTVLGGCGSLPSSQDEREAPHGVYHGALDLVLSSDGDPETWSALEGQRLAAAVAALRAPAGEILAREELLITDGGFRLTIPAVLAQGVEHRFDWFVDRNTNGACDPPTDSEREGTPNGDLVGGWMIAALDVEGRPVEKAIVLPFFSGSADGRLCFNL